MVISTLSLKKSYEIKKKTSKSLLIHFIYITFIQTYKTDGIRASEGNPYNLYI